MKKLLLSVFLTVISVTVYAQLNVYSTGSIGIATSLDNEAAVKVTIGTTFISGPKIGLFSTMNRTSLGQSIGLRGEAIAHEETPNGYDTRIGLMGRAGKGTDGYNYGTYGEVYGSKNGAGIYGTSGTVHNTGGRYAAYFNGESYVNGKLTATELYIPSDLGLKENIVPLSDIEESTTTLDNVLSLNVLRYNYKEKGINEEEIELAKELSGTDFDKEQLNAEIRNRKEAAQKTHYGLSAQELQSVYPKLVEKGQDGYLGVNYVEMVPVLIRAIQELKEEIDKLKGTGTVRKSPTVSTTSVDNVKGNSNMLYQNTPNPAKNQTIIRYQLAEDAQDAAICIFDMTGKLVKKFPISSGTNNLVINGYELGQGMFLYSLIVNGQEIDTKKMIISK